MYTDASLAHDVEKIKQISIVPTMLEVICRSTGMGFAAIARVTNEKWIACSVKDEILFRLESGGELVLETTICNEIRDNRQAVVIDHVAESELFKNHHTPLMYGFQSYISIPIILKNGDFFGTLCAIDPNPAELNNVKTIGMFNMFADLISFHLEALDLVERSNATVQSLNRQLTDSLDENRQYRHISNHNLQEPLRKIRVFSSSLIEATEHNNIAKVKELAQKVNSSAQKFSMMIQDLSDFSQLNSNNDSFEIVDLNEITADVCLQLSSAIESSGATIEVETLPNVFASRLQIEQLFYHLINNTLRFSKKDQKPVIRIFSNAFFTDNTFAEIHIEDNGMGIEKSQLEKIFDLFTKLPQVHGAHSKGMGLAFCRKIARNHGGDITAYSEAGQGSRFCVTLPVMKF
jgi:signal transduction histidine kinase